MSTLTIFKTHRKNCKGKWIPPSAFERLHAGEHIVNLHCDRDNCSAQAELQFGFQELIDTAKMEYQS